MFRIECYVDDKKLHILLRGLQGLALGAPGVWPAENAVYKNGKLQAEAAEGTSVGMFIEHIRKQKLRAISPKQARAFLKEKGRSVNSYSHLLRDSIKRGVLKKEGSGADSRYVVQPTSPAVRKRLQRAKKTKAVA